MYRRTSQNIVQNGNLTIDLSARFNGLKFIFSHEPYSPLLFEYQMFLTDERILESFETLTNGILRDNDSYCFIIKNQFGSNDIIRSHFGSCEDAVQYMLKLKSYFSEHPITEFYDRGNMHISTLNVPDLWYVVLI